MCDLFVVYRYYEGHNAKTRPGWFSKECALRSFVLSLAQTEAEIDVHYLVDTIEPSTAVREIMTNTGTVHCEAMGSNALSWRRSLELAVSAAEGHCPVVLFIEDDYVFSPSFVSQVLRWGSSGVGEYLAPMPELGRTGRPADGWRSAGVGPYVRIRSTCLTFAARAVALVEDAPVFRGAGVDDYAAWTSLTRKTVQGPKDVIHQFRSGATVPHAMKSALLSLYLRRRRQSERTLVRTESPIALHCELALLTGEDNAIAQEWLHQQGLP